MPKKLDPHTSSGQKVLGMYSLLLFTGRAYTLGQLAGLFACSKQTVLRTVEEIEMTHRLAVDSWVEGKERWYKTRTPAQRPNVTLTVEDIQQLLLCRDIVWHWLPEGLRGNIENSIAKAAVLLPEYDGRSEALQSLAGARPKGVVDYSQSQQQMNAIMKAMRERRVCEVAYHSPERDKPKVLAVAPYQILAYREGLYVRCRMEKALAEPEKFYDPTLALHRMKTVTVTDRKFRTIAVKPEQASGNGFGLSRGEPFRVVVDIVPKAAMYVRERIWSPDQVIVTKPDGGLRLEFTANSRVEVLNWVLSFGGEALLREPQDIREELLRRLETMRRDHAE
jgi:predicted DNA-binding transcriptional regulator YafY